MSDVETLRQTVAIANAIFFRLGPADHLGHASARLPDAERLLFKPRHSQPVQARGTIPAEQSVAIDCAGNLVGDGTPLPGERFIRTLNEQLLLLERYATVEDLRAALLAFKERCNRERLIQGAPTSPHRPPSGPGSLPTRQSDHNQHDSHEPAAVHSPTSRSNGDSAFTPCYVVGNRTMRSSGVTIKVVDPRQVPSRSWRM